MRVGLDIGSTTIKCVVLDENDTLLYSTYERHYSHILEKAQELLRRIDAEQLHGRKALLSISGSAGMGLADSCGVPFVQEVFSTRVAVKRFMPKTDCVIELGGEDAKILFLTNGTEVRMNGSCAGGTGAFIDQMATLLKMSAEEMNKAAEQAQRTLEHADHARNDRADNTAVDAAHVHAVQQKHLLQLAGVVVARQLRLGCDGGRKNLSVLLIAAEQNAAVSCIDCDQHGVSPFLHSLPLL